MNGPAIPPGIQIERVATRYGTMYAPAGDSVIGRSLRLYGEWAEHEIDVVSQWLTNADAILDVGANIGTHSIAFATRFPRATVFAIEPQPLPCAMLIASSATNGLSNIHVYNLGASNTARVVPVRFDYEALEGNAGAFNIERFRAAQDDGFPLLLVPVDHLNLSKRVQFIKIDVEGMETAVLLGATETLRKSRPIVFFEVLEIASLAASRTVLQALDYDLYWLETWPFNENNVRGATENVWSVCEFGILAFPREAKTVVTLPPVTGSETELPRRRDPSRGYTGKPR